MLFDFELSRGSLRRLLVIVLAVMMIFSQFAVIGYADDGNDQAYAAKASASGDAGEDTNLIDYDGDSVGVFRADGNVFGMFSPQEGTEAVVNNGMVDITYFPKNTTVYAGFHYGLITDEDLTLDVAFNENGTLEFSVPVEMCGKGIPIAPIKNSDGTTTNAQYYLCIPTRDKLPEGGSGDLPFSVDGIGHLIWTSADVFNARIDFIEDDGYYQYTIDESEIQEVFLQYIINDLVTNGEKISRKDEYSMRIYAWDEDGNLIVDQDYTYVFTPQIFDNNEQADLDLQVGETKYINLLCNDISYPDEAYVDYEEEIVTVKSVQGADERMVGHTRMYSITANREGYASVLFCSEEGGKHYAEFNVHVSGYYSGDASGNAGDTSGNAGDISGDASGNPGQEVYSVEFNQSRISVIEGSQGYTETRYVWDDNTQTQIEDTFFMYRTWEIIKQDGNQITINGDDVYTYRMGYHEEYDCDEYGFYNDDGKWLDYQVSDSQYDDHWQLGGVYTVTLMCGEKSCTFEVEIVVSPIQSVEFIPGENISFMENMEGWYDSIYRYDDITDEWVEEKYYYYPDYSNYVYTDGSKVIVDGNEEFVFDSDWQNDKPDFINSNGEFLSVKYGDLELSDDQKNNHWVVDGNNRITISLLGRTCYCPVTIIENPVKSIELIPVENLYCYKTEGRTPFSEGPEYYFAADDQVYIDGTKFVINGTDVYTYKTESKELDGGCGFVNSNGDVIDKYSISCYTSGTVEEGITLEVEYMGRSYSLPVEVRDNPISLIEFEPVNVLNFYEGTEDINELYCLPAEDGDKLIINYSDGSSAVYTYGYHIRKDEYGNNRFFHEFYSADGFIGDNDIELLDYSDISEWTAPGQYTLYFAYKGFTFSISANYLENIYEGIEFEFGETPILYENFNGYWEDDEGVEFFKYNEPMLTINGSKLTIIYKNGDREVYTYSDDNNEDGFYNENGERLPGYINRESDQYSNRWTVGSENYMTVIYKGCSCQVPVTVVENKVESIEFIPVGGSIAYIVAGEDHEQAYTTSPFPYNNGDAIVVTYDDGSTSRYTFQYHPMGMAQKNFVDENGRTLYIYNVVGQSAVGPDENSWMIDLFGQKVTGTYDIRDDNVKSVSVSVKHPVNVKDYNYESFTDENGVEYIRSHWAGMKGDPGDYQEYRIFRQGDTITITDLDDNVTVYTFQEDKSLYGFYDPEGNELPFAFLRFSDNAEFSDPRDPDNYDQYWSTAKDNEIYVSYLGHRATEAIKVNINEESLIDISDPETTVELRFADAIYTGEELKPLLTVTVEGVTLTEGKDYTVTYKDNTAIGAATVTITGIGNYTGTITRTFEIICVHDWDEGTVETQPTCTEPGVKICHCTICGETKSEELAALGHSEEVLAAVEPTCTEAGLTEGKKCSRCGDILVAQEVIPALGHAEEVMAAAEPTCTETGLTEGKKCSRCGEILIAQEVIPAIGHDWGEWTVVKEPTINEEGLEERVCANDPSHVEKRAIPKIVPKNGWLKEDGVWYYYVNDEKQTGWKKISDKWYYMDETGAMQTGLTEVSGKWYYLNASGVMQTGWQQIDEVWYYFNASGVMQTGWQTIKEKKYYFDESGMMQTGWQEIDGSKYFFNNSGSMATGWKKISDKWYYFNDTGIMATGWKKISDKWYYLDASGVMQTGWQSISGKEYYLDDSGVMQTGWKQIDEKWYYFNTSGVLQTGWKKISDKWYYFHETGEMLTGWQKIDDKDYFFKSSGAMAANEWVKGYWWLNANGTWTYKYKGSWKKSGEKWWFGDTSGWYAKNTTVTIDGKQYTFDASGYMV